ncbi:MAG: FHA domain-containing protein, partial [Candidatus Ornithomonoglobus sp.]
MISKDDGVLIILNGSEPVREIDLSSIKKNRISFGRGDMNDVVIASTIVSKLHGYIENIEDTLYIYDNNSTNGIFINDIYYGADARGDVELHRLTEGDIIRIDDADGARNADKGIIILYTKQKSGGNWREYSLSGVDNITIGRSRGNDIQLSSVQISRSHAAIKRKGRAFFISDNGSSNGTFVNGERIISEQELHERDVIYLANTALLFAGNTLFYKTIVSGTRVLMQGVNRTVKDKKSKTGTKKILNNVNIQIEPNEFVAIIGGSGSGKTTIMNAMSGYEKATSGRVYINSVDLYKHYKVLKNIIGYVPQQDIIYENLSLTKTLEHSAKLRMPKDVSNEEINKRIAEVLELVELTPHKDKMIRSLSGGQKKRASIAVELLADPGLFFLDEPTSGLDPGTEESLMKSLRNLAKRNNKTVIMVTHTTQNLHLCDKIILMGTDGNICFYGTVPDCLKTFGVKNLTEVYNKISKPEDVKKWSNEYFRKEGIKTGFKRTEEGDVPKPKRESLFKQLSILTARYMNLIKNDRQRLIMILAQPILIGILLAFVASDTVFEIYNGTKSILFALSCAG